MNKLYRGEISRPKLGVLSIIQRKDPNTLAFDLSALDMIHNDVRVQGNEAAHFSTAKEELAASIMSDVDLPDEVQLLRITCNRSLSLHQTF